MSGKPEMIRSTPEQADQVNESGLKSIIGNNFNSYNVEVEIKNNDQYSKSFLINLISKKTAKNTPETIKNEFDIDLRFKNKLENYNKIRKRIFSEELLERKADKIKKIRDRFNKRKLFRKSIVSSIINNDLDDRPYLEVEILGHKIKGLVDTGASVSVLGKDSISFLNKLQILATPVYKVASIKTANGTEQPIEGSVRVNINYNNKNILMNLLIVPSLTQNLYLGSDFVRNFDLAPALFPNIDEIAVEKLDANTHSLDEEEQIKLQNVIQKFPSFLKLGRGLTHILKHTIDTGDSLPIKQRYYPYSPAVQKKIESEVDKMLAEGIIQPSESSWSSPLTVVIKPGKTRICLDARKLNSVTKPLAYPMPIIGGLLARLADTVYISSVDLKDAFWQVELDDQSREKTAFSIPNRPLYEFKVMPFGLSNAAQRLCQLMDRVIPSKYRERIFVYLDDLLIFSATFEEHIELLEIVAERLRYANLTINVEKSRFCFRELRYLGYIVGQGQIRTDPLKVAAINDYPEPKNIKQLRSFLGLASWYRRFIRNFSEISAPLSDCLKLKKGMKFCITNEAKAAFKDLKRKLCSAPVLVNPNYDKPFIVQCDASKTGVGAVLAQLDSENIERPICYFSHKLNPAQKNYSITELECLAAVLGVKFFRPYIEGHEFRIVTDHSSLRWLMSQKDLSGRLARWSMKLTPYNFTIEHRKGSLNTVPDCLSRSFTEEISLHPPPIDLESKEFKSQEYLSLLKTIEDNKEFLPDSKVDKGFAYKRIHFRTTDILNENSVWRLWVPENLRHSIIENLHSPPNSAHGGKSKTLQKVKEFFFWPKMARDVDSFVNTCDTCKQIKPTNQNLRPLMGKPFLVQRPFQHVYADFLGPYPKSKNGHMYIIILVDQLTKFPLAKAITKATALGAIKFFDEYFNIFGFPESILTDNGTQFVSKMLQEYLSSEGIKHLKTGSYAPQSNASERVNRSIITGIRAYIQDCHKNWDLHLNRILAAIRSSIHTTIGTSPYKALFGLSMVEHASTYKLMRQLNTVNESDENVYPFDVERQLLRENLINRIEKAHEKYAKEYNTRAKDRSFTVGQEVLKRNIVLSNAGEQFCKKFAPKFKKCRIKKIVGGNLYELENLTGESIGTYHAKDIILY